MRVGRELRPSEKIQMDEKYKGEHSSYDYPFRDPKAWRWVRVGWSFMQGREGSNSKIVVFDPEKSGLGKISSVMKNL